MTIFKTGKLDISIEYIMLHVQFYSSENTGRFGVRMSTSSSISGENKTSKMNRKMGIAAAMTVITLLFMLGVIK